MARFFVNRPIVAMVISIITVLLGLVAMSGLPISQYPEVVPPMVQVTTTFVGASATDVEASVATPLEQQINGSELPNDQKIKLQSYITGCYGSLTSCNVLFADEKDRFQGTEGKD